MTPRKPKPCKPAPRKSKPRKTAGSTLATRVSNLEMYDANALAQRRDLARRITILETRSRYRDASHDEPVSHRSEAIGHFTLTEPKRPWWRRFINFMGAA
jgi:hypothetical protein